MNSSCCQPSASLACHPGVAAFIKFITWSAISKIKKFLFFIKKFKLKKVLAGSYYRTVC